MWEGRGELRLTSPLCFPVIPVPTLPADDAVVVALTLALEEVGTDRRELPGPREVKIILKLIMKR